MKDYKYAGQLGKCPKCGSDDLDSTFPNFVEDSAYQERRCQACDLIWTDIFDFKRQLTASKADDPLHLFDADE